MKSQHYLDAFDRQDRQVVDGQLKCKTGTPCGKRCLPRGQKCREGGLSSGSTGSGMSGLAKAGIAAGATVGALGAGAVAAHMNRERILRGTGKLQKAASEAAYEANSAGSKASEPYKKTATIVNKAAQSVHQGARKAAAFSTGVERSMKRGVKNAKTSATTAAESAATGINQSVVQPAWKKARAVKRAKNIAEIRSNKKTSSS